MDKRIRTMNQLAAILRSSQGTKLEGIYPGYDGTYGYPLNIDEAGGDK